MKLSNTTLDIVKSIKRKAKPLNNNVFTESWAKKYFSYNKQSGVLKVKEDFPNSTFLKKGYIIEGNSKRIYFKGIVIIPAKIVWLYVNGVYSDKVYFTEGCSLKYKNLTLSYSKSKNRKLTVANQNYPKKHYKDSFKEYPSQETLRFHFNKVNGELFWKKPKGRANKNKPAGYLFPAGLRQITFHGVKYNADILISIYETNSFENYTNKSKSTKRKNVDTILDFDHKGFGFYKSYKNGDTIDLRKSGEIVDSDEHLM
ncbi:hypothetical protein N9043_00780 [bacterium]|nr:hypothetical protein [bacterium]